MSHFCVLVIGENLEKQLSKFDENKKVPRYVEYTKEQLIEKERRKIQDYKKSYYDKYLLDPETYEKNCNSEAHINYLKNEFPKKLEFSEDELYNESIEFYEQESIGSNGEVFSTYNPDSKWDWYTIGGRYAGLLVVKEGVEVQQPNFSWGWDQEYKNEILSCGLKTDSAKVKDLDFSKMHQTIQEYNDCLRYWELIVEGAEPKNEEEEKKIKFNFYKPEFYIERYKTKEFYAKCRSSFSTWAVVKDGQWYEKGKMGFWAMSDETDDEAVDWEVNFFDRFIKDLPGDTLLTIVDCHI